MVRPLHVDKMLVSYLIGEQDTYHDIKQETILALKQKLCSCHVQFTGLEEYIMVYFREHDRFHRITQDLGTTPFPFLLNHGWRITQSSVDLSIAETGENAFTRQYSRKQGAIGFSDRIKLRDGSSILLLRLAQAVEGIKCSFALKVDLL